MTSWTLSGRRRSAWVAAIAAAAAWLSLPASGPAGTPGPSAIVDPALRTAHGTVSVIVQGTRSVEAAARDMGAQVTHELPLIEGFSATVPAADVPRIAQLPGASAVTLDRQAQVQGVVTSSAPGSTNTIPSVFRKTTRTDQLQATTGARGQGVTVALIDTGVTALPDVANALVNVSTDPTGLTHAPCVNLTNEATCRDSYGHGTFMAGLIAGNGTSSSGQYVGMAPAAKIVSIKIAGASGSSDVSTIIAAIQWAVSFKDTYNIRVINLSLGTDSTQSYTIDPLDYAVERAWQRGLVVDVAASNRGPDPYTISDPANDPFVVTVGAVDDRGTSTLADDELPNFSGRGPTATDGLAKPDIAAPGAHVVSLAAPNASITNAYPSTMPAPYRRGSGTSMANAVVTGLVADLLSVEPNATPDRVKYQLMAGARTDGASTDPLAVGRGMVDAYAAFTAGSGVANVGVTPSTGTGSLEASRGTVAVQLYDLTGDVLDSTSNLDAQGLLWDPSVLLTDPWSGNSWYGNSWYGNSWYGNSWYGNSWYGNSWYGATMNGVPDQTQDYGNSWYGSSWYGAWDQ
jgi:serine protease AprX